MPALHIGHVYRHSGFYLDQRTGELKAKFLVALAYTPGGDIVARLLTSRQHGRPENPPCYHGDPYPGYYVGVLIGVLGAKSWVVLNKLDDLDDGDAARLMRVGILTETLTLPKDLIRPLLECVARADDTTHLQERAIRDQLANLP